MRGIFIEAKSNADIKKAVERAIKLLPNKVGIVTTAQHKHKLNEIKKILEKNKIKAEIGGQILGCDASAARKIKDKVDAFLYVGSGRFHPIEVQLKTGKKVIMANPLTDEAKQLEKQEIERLEKQQKGALVKFLSSKQVGIIVSSKPGQNKLKKAFELKKKLKDKNCYIFAADTIDPAEFENFPFIESWVNTACPRFADEKKGVLNYEVLEKAV
jgi:2-(3-amino-3-carboxypropyl)histidine synthase